MIMSCVMQYDHNDNDHNHHQNHQEEDAVGRRPSGHRPHRSGLLSRAAGFVSCRGCGRATIFARHTRRTSLRAQMRKKVNLTQPALVSVRLCLGPLLLLHVESIARSATFSEETQRSSQRSTKGHARMCSWVLHLGTKVANHGRCHGLGQLSPGARGEGGEASLHQRGHGEE